LRNADCISQESVRVAEAKMDRTQARLAMALRILRNLLVAAALLVPMAPALAGDGHPTPVPNLTDPAVLDEFMPLALSRLNEDPDFPMLLLGRLGQASPQYLLVIYDARNGKDTWSVREDVAVFYVLFEDGKTVRQVFLDEGFAGKGEPSGSFLAAGPEGVDGLLARLQESHRRSRGVARSGLRI